MSRLNCCSVKTGNTESGSLNGRIFCVEPDHFKYAFMALQRQLHPVGFRPRSRIRTTISSNCARVGSSQGNQRRLNLYHSIVRGVTFCRY